tara:strand:+ start:9041 stop:9535 length:495 start_codon:yes stop_codon:yes gene_type:complete
MLTKKKLNLIKNAISVFDLLDQEIPPKVVFTTQRDNRVDDKICLELSGLSFEIDSPLRPIIPDDTHPNCRCYYVDEQTGQIVTDISSKRRGKRNTLTDRQRKNWNKKDKRNLTQKKMNLIVDVMEQNEEWQSKSKDFIPSDDTGIRPLRYNASLEKIRKWLDMI